MQISKAYALVGAFLAIQAAADAFGGTISGRVQIPPSTFGWQPSLSGMQVRIEGTPLTAQVDGSTGDFSFATPPDGALTLVLEENNQDVFTAASKRIAVVVNGDVTGVSFDLKYHWRSIGYPAVWGQPGYNQWNAQFVSDQVIFILFRVSSEGIDPERMELWRSVDGGESWSTFAAWGFDQAAWNAGSPYPDRQGRVFHFLDADHGVVLGAVNSAPCSGGSGMFYTADGGQSWNYVGLPRVAAAYPCNIDRFAQISSTHLIAAGGLGCHVQGYGSGFYDVIWESTDAGATWQIATSWSIDYGGCTGLGAGPDGSAVAFYTPYGGGERRIAIRNPDTGAWQVTESNALVVNSGYGPGDVSFVDRTAWARADGGSLPAGLYRSDEGGAAGSWTKVSDAAIQYLDFVSDRKGFGTAGGPMHVTYDGGQTWLYQAAGGGYCCHGNDVWGFDTVHAAWHDAGVGDPDGAVSLLTYSEPWLPDFEIVPGVALADGVQRAGDVNVPAASYKLFCQGPVPITVNALTFHVLTGTDSSAVVSKVKLWHDKDASGNVTAGDAFLSEGVFANGNVVLATGGLLLTQYYPVHVLFTFDLAGGTSPLSTAGGYVLASGVAAVRADFDIAQEATGPSDYKLEGREITIGESLFADNFEMGLVNWSATTDDAEPDAGYGWWMDNTDSASGSSSVRCHEDRNHATNRAVDYLTLTTPLNLSAAGEYRLTFEHKYALDPSFYLYVEASDDGGQNWDRLSTYGSWDWHSTGGHFVHEELDLSGYAGQANVLVRFQFDWSAAWYYNGWWWVDDVRILRLPGAEPPPTEPPPTEPPSAEPPPAEPPPTDTSGPEVDDNGAPGEPEGPPVEDDGTDGDVEAWTPPPARAPMGFCGAGLAQTGLASALLLAMMRRGRA